MQSYSVKFIFDFNLISCINIQKEINTHFLFIQPQLNNGSGYTKIYLRNQQQSHDWKTLHAHGSPSIPTFSPQRPGTSANEEVVASAISDSNTRRKKGEYTCNHRIYKIERGNVLP